VENQNDLANAIVASMPSEEPGPDDESTGEASMSDMAIEELFVAIENKDVAAFRDTLRSIMEMMDDGE
jgi:hypothetical protein